MIMASDGVWELLGCEVVLEICSRALVPGEYCGQFGTITSVGTVVGCPAHGLANSPDTLTSFSKDEVQEAAAQYQYQYQYDEESGMRIGPNETGMGE
jgi:hypothetical protein